LEDIKTLQDLGLIKPAEAGKAGTTDAVNMLKDLKEMGLIQIGGGFNQEYTKLMKSFRDSDRAFYLALYNITQRQLQEMERLGIEREKLGTLRTFAERIGAAAARAIGEEEEEKPEEKEKEPKKIIPGRKEGELEVIKCGVCGSDMPIPPEKQKPGARWSCPLCKSVYEYSKAEKEQK